MERLGILGGTFDPPHNGHLALAGESLRQLHLTSVVWVLTPDPPHKDLPDITAYIVRREMLETAIAGIPAYRLSEVESERAGPHFMVDTISILQERNPKAELILLLGEDSLRDLPTWHRPGEILVRCELAVLRRSDRKADMVALETDLPGIGARTTFLDAAPVDISSTEIRERIRQGKAVAGMMPDAVEKIIRRELLYA
jgi:nicotinate (nicotinamide) nucleotide adenylyltransferase